mgnify:CR=1 FL=1
MDIRFESLGLRRGQNSAKEISEAYARASALKKPTPPGKPPRLLSAKRSRHNIGRFDLYAEKEKNEKIVRPPLPHVPSKDIVTMKVGQGLSIDSRLRDDDTWQFHTSWFRDGSTVWRWVSQVLLFNAVEKTVGYTKNDMYVAQMEYFIQCVQDKTISTSSFGTGRMALNIAFNVKKSVVSSEFIKRRSL